MPVNTVGTKLSQITPVFSNLRDLPPPPDDDDALLCALVGAGGGVLQCGDEATCMQLLRLKCKAFAAGRAEDDDRQIAVE